MTNKIGGAIAPALPQSSAAKATHLRHTDGAMFVAHRLQARKIKNVGTLARTRNTESATSIERELGKVNLP